MPRVVVPKSCQTSDVPRATHLDYSPATHPRPLNAGEDAQRVFDGVVNSNSGIADRVAFDGGFRMDRPGKPLHGEAVTDAIACSAKYYAQNGGDPEDVMRINRSQLTYGAAVSRYWEGRNTTPPDPAR